MAIPMQETNQDQSMQDSLPPPFEEGYSIIIQVLPTGFSVSDPQPLSSAPEDADLQDTTSVLKAVLSILQSNPVGEDSAEQMKAGFESE